MTVSMRVVAAFVAAVVLFAACGSASANRSLLVEGTTQTLTGTLTFTGPSIARCFATLTTTLSRFIPKIANTVIGRVTSLRAECPLGNPIVALGTESESAWTLRYQSYLGTLPMPSGYTVRVEHMQWLMRAAIGSCLFEGSELLRESIEAGGTLGALTTEATPTRVPLLRTLSGICSANATVEGSLTPQRTSSITLV